MGVSWKSGKHLRASPQICRKFLRVVGVWDGRDLWDLVTQPFPEKERRVSEFVKDAEVFLSFQEVWSPNLFLISLSLHDWPEEVKPLSEAPFYSLPSHWESQEEPLQHGWLTWYPWHPSCSLLYHQAALTLCLLPQNLWLTPRNREGPYCPALQILLLQVPGYQSPGARSPTPKIVCCIGRSPGANREGFAVSYDPF